VGWKIWR